MLLAAITYYPLYLWLGTVTQPGNILSDRGLHHLYPHLLCRDGVWAGRGVPGGILPRKDWYTSVSVPYHIDNRWGGGLVPFITSVAFAATRGIG